VKKALKVFALATLLLSTFSGCVKKSEATTVTEVTPADNNRFQTINTRETTRAGSVEVVCHNCRATFKLSPTIQKMSMKGDAIVDCPVCHQNYLKGKK
jgi:Zn finger protein HypA/HybF involved in hydrogenase expression